MSTKMNSIVELVEDLRQGKMVLLVDDEGRENEGDLVLASEFVTPEKINFMIQKARGLVCLALTPEQVARLELPMMVQDDRNFSPNKTAFTVSIEAARGVSTGISTADRAHTIQVAADPKSGPKEVISPGHIFPIRAQKGGVLRRAGHTEGSVDLVRLAGLNPAAVICEVINDDGSMARVPHLMDFAREHNLKIGSIVDLIQYRLQTERLVTETLRRQLHIRGRQVMAYVFRSDVDGSEHVAVVKGLIDGSKETLVRVHVENIMADLFSFTELRASQWQSALNAITDAEQGVFLHLRPSNRVHGLSALLEGRSESDELDYGVGAQILSSLGVRRVRLLTHSPGVVSRPGLRAYGLEIGEIQSLNAGGTEG